jgi:hypothetical protein
VLLVATGAERDFYLGEIVKGRKPKDGPDKYWRQSMEQGSLIIMPDAMNYTHWHAILKNTPKNRKRYGVPDRGYGLPKGMGQALEFMRTGILLPPKETNYVEATYVKTITRKFAWDELDELRAVLNSPQLLAKVKKGK